MLFDLTEPRAQSYAVVSIVDQSWQPDRHVRPEYRRLLTISGREGGLKSPYLYLRVRAPGRDDIRPA